MLLCCFSRQPRKYDITMYVCWFCFVATGCLTPDIGRLQHCVPNRHQPPSRNSEFPCLAVCSYFHSRCGNWGHRYSNECWWHGSKPLLTYRDWADHGRCRFHCPDVDLSAGHWRCDHQAPVRVQAAGCRQGGVEPAERTMRLWDDLVPHALPSSRSFTEDDLGTHRPTSSSRYNV